MPRPNSERWISAVEFARRFHHAPSTVREWCRLGRIPAKRRGKKVWFVDLQATKRLLDADLQEIFAERAEDLARGFGMHVTDRI